jgi:hypothetical protein
MAVSRSLICPNYKAETMLLNLVFIHYAARSNMAQHWSSERFNLSVRRCLARSFPNILEDGLRCVVIAESKEVDPASPLEGLERSRRVAGIPMDQHQCPAL